MKITFVVSALTSGGSERTVSYLSESFANDGHEVSIVCLSNDVFYDVNKNVKLITFGIPSTSTRSLSTYLRVFKRYIRCNFHLFIRKPDVVICILPSTVKYVAFIHKLLKFRLISSERDNPTTASAQTIKQRLNAFNESDGVVFQTLRAQKFYPIDIIDKSVVIPNAVGNPFVYNIGEIKNRRKTFVAIGRLFDKQKDYITLIEAFKIFCSQYDDYTLEIYGEGPDEEKIKRFINDNNLSEKVFLCGAHKDAIIRASDATAYIMSSRYEGMPNALMEAMAIGLPCISTDCPNGPAELIESGVNGILIPVSHSDELCKAMVNIVENPALAEEMGRCAKSILKTNSIASISKQYLDFASLQGTN